MSILGVVVRAKPGLAGPVAERLGALPGVEVAQAPGDGRLVVVVEDLEAPAASEGGDVTTAASEGGVLATTAPGGGGSMTAAETLAAITGWPEVLSTSLVYEYSGPDAPAPGAGDVTDYRSWRDGLAGKADLAVL